MERIEGYKEKFCSLEEMQKDIYDAVCRAYDADDAKFQVIKAIAGGGKSYNYMKLMEEHPTTRFLIAAPTNLLKDEIFTKAVKLGLEVMMTPSLEEIKDEMPENVWKHIQKLYKRGQHEQVHSYIYEVIKKKKIPCLEKYVKGRKKIKNMERKHHNHPPLPVKHG